MRQQRRPGRADSLLPCISHREDQPLHTASLRVNFMRQFRSSHESRYVGTASRVGRSSGIGEAQAIGGDGEIAIVPRVTAYR